MTIDITPDRSVTAQNPGDRPLIDDDTAETAADLLATAILEMLEDAAATCAPLPRNRFQRRMHLARLAKVGGQINQLALSRGRTAEGKCNV